MCCQLAAADQWCDVKEARTRKILNESNRSVALLRGLWCGPRTKCSNVGFSSSSKIWSRIRFMETKRVLVQRNPQCAGCCIVPDISIQRQVSPLFAPVLVPVCPSWVFSSPPTLGGSHTCQHAHTWGCEEGRNE